MKTIYIALITLLLSAQGVQAQHTKKAHKAAKKVHREAKKTTNDHNRAMKLEKKRLNRHHV